MKKSAFVMMLAVSTSAHADMKFSMTCATSCGVFNFLRSTESILEGCAEDRAEMLCKELGYESFIARDVFLTTVNPYNIRTETTGHGGTYELWVEYTNRNLPLGTANYECVGKRSVPAKRAPRLKRPIVIEVICNKGHLDESRWSEAEDCAIETAQDVCKSKKYRYAREIESFRQEECSSDGCDDSPRALSRYECSDL